MPHRVAYAILFADDLEASIRFYRDTLGVPFRFSNETYAEFATEGAKFALFSRGATLHLSDPDGNVVELTRPKR